MLFGIVLNDQGSKNESQNYSRTNSNYSKQHQTIFKFMITFFKKIKQYHHLFDLSIESCNFQNILKVK